ncbi:MAG: hypothetical protein QGF53_14200, partial [Alphaproteobacteria bacterium]|nr:hypothetical protein [Alphaproteobacteria bacterium]
IRKHGLIEGERSHEFHLRLSRILRAYVVWRFNARALTQTTEEFLAAAPQIEALGDEHSGLVGGLLARCDLAKFAGLISTPAAMTESLESAEGFITKSASSGSFAPNGATLETS